jgi:hypothetical protein
MLSILAGGSIELSAPNIHRQQLRAAARSEALRLLAAGD